MEVRASTRLHWLGERLKSLFFRKSEFSSKKELNLSSFKWLGIISILVFISIVLLMPDEVPVQFTQKISQVKGGENPSFRDSEKNRAPTSSQLWAAPTRENYRGTASTNHINYNTAMVVGAGGNAKTQLHAGLRLPLRILDKVVVSQEPVPVLAELLLDSETDSGLKLPAGSRFYGEASFARGSDRAQISFRQMSLPSGQMKPINAKALGKDGQSGVPGRVYSDGVKNTAGQIITSFVGGLAAGSVQTDAFGRSQGGIGNGLLTAVAEAAKGKAQSYGDKLKAEREWMEIPPGVECDAQLFEALNLQEGGSGD